MAINKQDFAQEMFVHFDSAGNRQEVKATKDMLLKVVAVGDYIGTYKLTKIEKVGLAEEES